VLKIKKTDRGFHFIEFIDANDKECSLQESSLVEPHIWLGCNKNAEQHHVTREPLSPRMHLSQKQVKKLLPMLKKFAKTGKID
jgi:hypothetical protein